MSFQLKVSTIHGVGVFALTKFKKGESLELFEKEDYRFIKSEDIKRDKINLTLIENYTIPDNDGYHAPKNFSCMSVGWFLNHSDDPNATFDENYDYFALKNILPNEEITINYDDL
ncbi:hypothetical protein BH10BAC5_BH10BAC5_18140 [soil metagenome]